MRGHFGRAGSGARGVGVYLTKASRADLANVVWRRVARHDGRGPGSERRSGLARSPRDFLRAPGPESGGSSPHPSDTTIRPEAGSISKGPRASDRATAKRGEARSGKTARRAPRGDPLFDFLRQDGALRPPHPELVEGRGQRRSSSLGRENRGVADPRPRPDRFRAPVDCRGRR